MIEVGMYLITACMGTYLPLVRYIWGKLRKARQKESFSLENNYSLSSTDRSGRTRDEPIGQMGDSGHNMGSVHASIGLEHDTLRSVQNAREIIMVERQFIVHRGESSLE
jgi:hypothetical protein